MKKLIAAAGVGASLIAVGLTGCTVTGTGTPTAATTLAQTEVAAPAAVSIPVLTEAQRVREWGLKAYPVIGRIQDDLDGLATSAENMDLPGVRSTCGTLSSDLDDLDGLLPTPNIRLTNELQGAVDDYQAMTAICQTLTLDSSSFVDDITEMTDLMTSGTGHVTAATAILKEIV
jgi:hypothetical protein